MHIKKRAKTSKATQKTPKMTRKLLIQLKD